MKKINIKNNKGITLVTLILAIVIMIIISSTLIYNSKTGISTRALNNMYNDIKMLKDRVEIYYAQYGTIPVIRNQYTNTSKIKGINVNDSDIYYVIDLEAIDNLTLTYGKDYKTYKSQGDSSEDIYIINEKSHTIYYIKGIEVDANMYYTIPDEYTKIEIPEVNKITLQKLEKGIATIEINAVNKNEGIKTVKLYKGDTVYKTYEYQGQDRERKKEILDIKFVAPQESEWYIEAEDSKGNITKSNRITINSDYYLKVEKPEDKTWDETKVDCYQDEDGVVIPVPKGFTPILKKEGQKTASTGFVIRDTSSNAETRGNEFVWVPCEIETETNKNNGRLKYNRYEFESFDYIGWSEEMPTEEKDSISIYEGYYIGRYEAGISKGEERTSKNITQTTEEIEAESGKAVVQANRDVYNNVKLEEAKGLAENVYIGKSRLCSSYGWDTALKFMEITGSTYPTNSVGGYYGQSSLTKTGNDITHPCNIYDMGGNVWEYTTEIYDTNVDYKSIRGGYYDVYPNAYPAARRDVNNTTSDLPRISFRITFYI